MLFSLDKISIIAFTIFSMVISIDPTGSILGIKELLFVFLLLFSFISFGKGDTIPKDVLFVIWVCLSLPMWGIMIAVLKDIFTDSSYAFGHLKSFLFILIFFFLRNLNFDKIVKVLFISGSLIALFTTLIFIIAQINKELFSLLFDQSLENDNIIISEREYYGFSMLGVYFKTGPFMFFSYIYSLYFLDIKHFRGVFILLNLFALLVAGSRTPTLIAILITVIYFYDRMKSNRLFKYAILYACGFALAFLTYKLATEKGEISNELKFADFHSYISNIFMNTTPIVGAGLGSEFYSGGRGQLVAASEQTYMDIIRIYGFFLGIVLIILIYYPALAFLRSKYWHILKYRRFIMAYILYMILAGTNPLLISSTGMLIWAVGLTFVYKIHKRQLRMD